MKTAITLAFVAMIVLSACHQDQKTDDPEVLKKLLVSYFDGVKAKDLNKLNAVTTRDFVLFEDGKIWTNDSLITNLNKYYKKLSAEFTFDNFEINVDNKSGTMRYSNHCDCIINDTSKMSFDWLESASFVKVDGTWKMNFLHSSIRK